MGCPHHFVVFMTPERALRNAIRFIHAVHWHGLKSMSKKQLRRHNYWERVAGPNARFHPRPPRGKRKRIYDTWRDKHYGRQIDSLLALMM